MQICLKLLLASYYSPCLTFASSIHQTLKNKKNEGAKNAGLAKVNILYVENYAEYVPHGRDFFTKVPHLLELATPKPLRVLVHDQQR